MKRRKLFYLVASAIVAYLYGFPTNGLSHFDEGQYAFARVWPWIDKFDVDQAFFSPPLYPFLVGLVQHLPITRPDLAGVYISWAACWASLYFGVKLAVAWWGRAAAFPAFVLLLLSPMRLAFGTIGLTDALFSALLLATLWCATNAFRRNSSSWTLSTALLAGSTWSCKYNGFIALGIIFGFVLHRRTASSVVRWLVICVVAAAIMAPWYWAIHTHHPEGIEALRRHQQGYLRGLTGPVIWENLAQALRLRAEVPGWRTLLLAWVVLGATLVARRTWLCLLGVSLILAGEDASICRLLPLLAIVVLPCSLAAARQSVRVPIVLAVLATVVLPGIYTPYLRLWLPAEHVMLLVVAGAVAGATRRTRAVRPRRDVIAYAALLLFIPSTIRVLAWTPFIDRSKIPETWHQLSVDFERSRRRVHPVGGYWGSAPEIIDRINAPDVRRVLVYARPPLLYYLASSKLRVPVQRMPDERIRPEQLTPGTMVVSDVAVRDSVHFADALREARLRTTLRRVASFDEVFPHPLTVLDDFGVLDRRWGDYKVSLYLVAPADESKP